MQLPKPIPLKLAPIMLGIVKGAAQFGGIPSKCQVGRSRVEAYDAGKSCGDY